jgi:hypothetical protein
MIIYSPTFTGSVQLTGSQIVTGDFTVRGNLTAQQFILSSSVTFYTESFSSGSTRFGDSMDDTMKVTGSLLLTGSMFINTVTAQNAASNRGNLTINGATSILNLATGDTNAGYLYHSGTDMLLVNAKNGVMQFYTNDTERMRITSGGNVGIGNNVADTINSSSGLGNLVVGNGGGSSQGITIYTNSSTYGGLNFADATSGGGAYAGYLKFDHTNDSMQFFIGNTERMRITSGGNVGIGVTPAAWAAPTAGKVIQIGNVASFFSYNNLTNDLGCNIYFNGSDYLYLQTGAASLYRQQSGEHSWFTVGSGTGGTSAGITERMKITSGGNVKIGNTSGDGRFYVKTSVANSFSPTVYAGANANIRLETGGTPAENITTGISFGVGGAAEAYIGAVQNSSTYADIVFQNYNGAYAERMRILSSGNVRFSSQVYGNTVASPRTLYIQSDGELGGVSSIRESKKNIENVSNINWIYQLNPVSFNYRKKDEEGNYTEEIYDEINYGLIAEDTAPVADFLINYNDKEDSTKEMVGIEYMRLITPMLKAIQELKAEIEELKNK